MANNKKSRAGTAIPDAANRKNLPIVYQRGRRMSNGKCEWVNA